MSDQPWNTQPSKIILPVDTILIEIDNRTNPVRVNMRPSREMPIPLVINIFSNLISQLSAQLAAAMAGGMPTATPPATPKTQEGNSNGAKT